MVEAQGAFLVYLPACSYDYNPIERAFSKIKAYLHREPLAESNAPPVIAAAFQSITFDDTAVYFENCGYPVLRLSPRIYLSQDR